jgi:hypothetical protein
MLRGGSWLGATSGGALLARSATRNPATNVSIRFSNLGFRVARTLPCVGDCTGRECGDDGCGGSCGACAPGICNDLVWTPPSTCSSGHCLDANQPQDCDDANVCTDDSCDDVAGCVHSNNQSTCNDGDPTTSDDKCKDGVCTGVYTCDDGNICTDGFYNPTTGCYYVPNKVECRPAKCDGMVHFDAVQCSGGSCPDYLAGVPCTNQDTACTVAACSPASGCIDVPKMSCDDNNPCTKDWCQNGGCKHSFHDADIACSDGNPCTKDLCDSSTGGCTHEAVPGPCMPANKCKTDATCVNGTCVDGSTPRVCDDGNPCTTDSCDPANGCSNQVVPDYSVWCLGWPSPVDDAPCISGVCRLGMYGCVSKGTCSLGYFNLGGTYPTCDQYGNDASVACFDGDVCTKSDHCAGPGQPWCTGTAVSCDDGDPATVDTCVASVGCVHARP